METSDELALREIEQKLGRNLLLYQKIELLLRALLTRNNISAPLSKAMEVVRKKAETVKVQTMGSLIKLFLEENALNPYANDKKVNESGEAWITLHTLIESEGLEDRVKSMVKTRNLFVHNFFDHFSLTSEQGVAEAIRYIDEEYQKDMMFYELLKSQLKFIQETSDWMESNPDIWQGTMVINVR